MEQLSREFHQGYQQYFQGLHVGAKELLEELQQQGIPQVLLSSSNQNVILRDTRRLEVCQYFDAILGAEDYHAGSKVQRGLTWISQQPYKPGNVVMVGDTLHDFETAQAMGIQCILFSGGHQGKAELHEAGVPVVDDFQALGDILLQKIVAK